MLFILLLTQAVEASLTEFSVRGSVIPEMELETTNAIVVVLPAFVTSCKVGISTGSSFTVWEGFVVDDIRFLF